jgi:hypothetical protein
MVLTDIVGAHCSVAPNDLSEARVDSSEDLQLVLTSLEQWRRDV